MKRTILTVLSAFSLGLGLALIFATPSMAVHKGPGNLACGGCHTMHNSQGSASLGGGPSIVLLRGSLTNGRRDMANFCLQCHASNGTQSTTAFNGTATAPKVYIDNKAGMGIAAANTDPFSFLNIGGGGDFSAVGTYTGVFTLNGGDTGVAGAASLGYGHSIGIASATPPGGTSATAIPDFTCTSCHDPHGRNVAQGSGASINLYRNLKYNITWEGNAHTIPMAGMFSWVGGNNNLTYAGTNATTNTHIWPVMNSAATTQSQYNTGAASGAQGVGTEFNNWCAQCHGLWHEILTASNRGPQDWTRHPVSILLNGATNGVTTGFVTSGAGVTIVDFAWYNSQANSRAPFSSVDATKLPAMQNAGGLTYYADTSTDQVFCLSCHYAHGGPNYDGLRWQHTNGVASGNQTGVGIASNVGCQQCHNR